MSDWYRRWKDGRDMTAFNDSSESPTLAVHAMDRSVHPYGYLIESIARFAMAQANQTNLFGEINLRSRPR
jgi:hypothetical protein